MINFILTSVWNFLTVQAEVPAFKNDTVFSILYFNYTSDFLFFLPEIILVSAVILILGFYVFQVSVSDSLVNIKNYLLIFIILFLFLLVLYIDLYIFFLELSSQGAPLNLSFFNAQVLISSYSFVLKLITIFFTIIFFFIAYAVIPYYWYLQVEHFCLIAFSIFGSLVLTNANDLLTFYLALEVSTIPLYILVSSKMRSNFSTEAGLKYFIMGSFSSGLILFGFSYLYGFTGLISFNDLELYFNLLDFNDIYTYFILLGIVLFISGLFIKVGIAPFHLWVVDVYSGAPILITFFMMTVPKIVLWGVSYQLIVNVFNVFFFNYISNYLVFCVAASFLLGIFPGLYQIKIKRLIIYSSIASNGFFLMPFFTSSLISLFVYLIIYLVTISGFFSFYFLLRNKDNLRLITKISELNNFYQVNPALAYGGSFLLFSMAGIPPFAGFLAKFYLYINTFFYIPGLVILSLFFGCVSTFYYIRFSKWMFFANSLSPASKNSWLFLVKPHSILLCYLFFAVFFNLGLIFYFDAFIAFINLIFY
jgi:NADH-quinone oxidoreductase subunit N